MSMSSFDPVAAVLLIPIGSAALLAALPGYRLTARLNVVASLATFLSALSLFVIERPAARALRAGRRSEHRLHRAQHLRRLHHQHLQRELHRPRTRDRPADADLPAFLPRHVPDHDVRHEPRFRVEQYRPDVGRGRNRDADHGADGRHLSHPRRAGSGLEIFHPGQRRNCVRAVRHHPGLHGGAAGRGRRPGRHGLDAVDRACRELRPRPSQRRLRIPVSRLRHQGRPRAAARLAARRARRRSDADIGRAVGPAAERRALCAAALQDIARRQSRPRLLPAR